MNSSRDTPGQRRAVSLVSSANLSMLCAAVWVTRTYKGGNTHDP